MQTDNDIEEINDVLARYATLFDARDVPAFLELFTDDLIVTFPDGREINGRERLGRAIAKTPIGGTHHPERAEVRVNGDSATSTQPYSARTSSGSVVTGVYHDVLRRTTDGWRIAVRRMADS